MLLGVPLALLASLRALSVSGDRTFALVATGVSVFEALALVTVLVLNWLDIPLTRG